MKKILVTCPPMLGLKEQFIPLLEKSGYVAVCPNFTQVMTEEALIEILPECDGWIIGDDPATRKVFEAGKKGRLKAAVKWGIGVDNVDFVACKDLGIPITNTPGMFGAEVSDVALAYLLGLARETYYIDREIRNGRWPKNQGVSLTGKTVGIVGYGDIGRNTTSRIQAFGMNTIVYDPGVTYVDTNSELKQWPDAIEKCDFIVFTCALTDKNRYMLNKEILMNTKHGVSIINVARGPLINEGDLIDFLKSGHVKAAALDVFEIEPLPMDSFLRDYPLVILGSHNSSNTQEAVERTNILAIENLISFLND